MKNFLSPLFLILLLLATGQLLSSCSSSQPFYFSKGTGSFHDPYKTRNKVVKPADLTADATMSSSVSDLSSPIDKPLTEEIVADNQEKALEKLILHKLSRQQQKQIKQRLEAILDTTKKRDRVTIQTNEKKIDDLRNEAERLKESVKAERNGDKVVVSFDNPQSNLSKEAKILIIVVAALLLVALLSLPIIGPVLGVVLGVAVVAAALALLLGIVEIS